MNLLSFAKRLQYNDYSLSLTQDSQSESRVSQIHRKILEIDEPTVDSRCPGKQEGCCEISESHSQGPSRTVIGKSQVSKGTSVLKSCIHFVCSKTDKSLQKSLDLKLS